MASNNLLSLVDQAIEKFPKELAIAFWHENCHVEISYSELLIYGERIRDLLASYSNRFVGFSIDVTYSFPILLYGILKAQCAFVPLDSKNGLGWNKKVVEKLKVKYILTNNLSQTALPGLSIAAEICLVSEALYLLDTGINSNNGSGWKVPLAYSVQSSGSCGEPKIIRVPHQSIVPNVIHLRDLLNVKNYDGILLESATTFDPCYVEVFLALSTGAKLCILGGSKFERLHNIGLAASLITIIQITPSLVRHLPVTSLRNFPKLRVLLLGGEECPGAGELESWGLNNVIVYNVYGITEVSCWAAIGKVWPPPRMPLTPLLETDLLINSNDSSDVAPLFIGSKSRICLLDDENFSTFDDSPVYRSTGDLFKKEDEGFIYVGRFGERVKRFGAVIDTRNICETAISAGAHEAAILVLQGSDSPSVHLFVSPSSVENMIWQNFHQSSPLSCPDSISSLPSLPLTRHGKVDKRALQQHLTRSRDEMDSEKLFSCLWKNHIFGKTVCESGFISSGGCSFSALLLISEMKLFWTVPISFLSSLLSDECYKNICNEVSKMKRTSNQRKRKRVIDVEVASNSVGDCFLESQWKAYLGKCVDSSPVLVKLDKEYVIVGSHSGVVAVIDVESGEFYSKITLPDRVESTACLHPSSNSFSIGCYDSYIYTFSLKGQFEWKFKTGDSVRSGGVTVNDCVVFGSYDGKVYCIECRGNLIWCTVVGGAVSAVPVILNDQALLAATIKGNVTSICIRSGNILWTSAVKGPVFSTPLFLDGEILIADVLGHITWMQPSTGIKIGALHLGEVNVFAKLVIWQGCAVVCCSDGSLRLVTKARQTLWRSVLDSPAIAAPCPISEFLAVATCRGAINLLTIDGCTACPPLELSADVFSSPVSTKTRIIVGCRDDYLHCLSLKNVPVDC